MLKEQKEQLLLSAGERPASVFFRGGEVRIDMHDAWYRSTLRRIKADIVALHPDMANNGFRRRREMCRTVIKATVFKYAQRNLKSWMREQDEWYATFGLMPPRVIGVARVTTFLYAPYITDAYKGSSHYVAPATPRGKSITVLQRMEIRTRASRAK